MYYGSQGHHPLCELLRGDAAQGSSGSLPVLVIAGSGLCTYQTGVFADSHQCWSYTVRGLYMVSVHVGTQDS